MGRDVTLVWLLILTLSGTACDEMMPVEWFGDRKAETAATNNALSEPTAAERALSNSLAFRDTIASMAYLEGLRTMRVRGYGIVAGLGDKGSAHCPVRIREYLIGEMEKVHGIGLAITGLGDLTPEELIASKDTAVVEVVGEIPAAATEGRQFDVTVSTFAGSQTLSLAGARLYTCDLKLFGSVGRGPTRAGKLLARAWGPIFVNPFNEPAASDARADVRVAVGRVLNGGRTLEPRRLRLQLTDPSYDRAYRIAARINERFTHEPKTADPVSPASIQLRVPPNYTGKEAEFLDLLQHLYLNPGHEFAAERAKQLAQEIVRPSAPRARIALAWEGIGRTVLPIVRALYTHDAPEVRYYAARTGLRLEDDLAVDVLAELATDATSVFYKDAMLDLGSTEYMYRATDVLKPLLDHEDPRVRVAAYEAVRDRYGSGIRPTKLGKDNFTLDVVPTTGPGLIHARHSGEPRIAIFGADLACQPPVFYTHPDRAVMINADENAKHLTVVRRTRFRGLTSPQIPIPLTVADLVGRLGDDPDGESDEERGLAMGYDQVIRILHTLCTKGMIPAKFEFDRPSITDVFGPLQPEGRPETDL